MTTRATDYDLEAKAYAARQAEHNDLEWMGAGPLEPEGELDGWPHGLPPARDFASGMLIGLAIWIGIAIGVIFAKWIAPHLH